VPTGKPADSNRYKYTNNRSLVIIYRLIDSLDRGGFFEGILRSIRVVVGKL
jgi:hypothetical protein